MTLSAGISLIVAVLHNNTAHVLNTCLFAFATFLVYRTFRTSRIYISMHSDAQVDEHFSRSLTVISGALAFAVRR
jgi:hypothetical protein